MSWDSHTVEELQAAHHVLTVMGDADDLAATLYEHWWAAPRPGGTSRGRWESPVSRASRPTRPRALVWSPQEPEPLVSGPRLRLTGRRDSRRDRGWWRTWGEEWPATGCTQDLTRLYLAARRVEVARLVHEITRVIPRITPQWSLQVATHAASLDRADAVVLHLPDTCRVEAFSALRAGCVDHVRNASPPFTEVLAPGMAWSEEPGDGQSFGELRCRWLSVAYQRAEARCGAFADVVAEVFGEHGVEPTTTHLRGLAVAA